MPALTSTRPATCRSAPTTRWRSIRAAVEPRWARVGARRDRVHRLGRQRASATMHSRLGRPAAAGRAHRLRADVRGLRAVGHAAHLRRGVVPARRGRLAALRPRLVAAHAARLDLDRSTSVGLAGASLRPLGPAPLARLVLDAAPHVGSGLGRLGGARPTTSGGRRSAGTRCRSWTSSSARASARWVCGPAAGR